MRHTRSDVAHGKLTDWLLRDRLAGPQLPAAAADEPHPTNEQILAYAADELTPDESLAVTRHLTHCPDDSCPSLFRAVVAGQAAARDVLYEARRAERSDGFILRRGERSDTVIRSVMPQHERHFQCDDELWAAFEQMAHAQDRTIDSLLNEALANYRSPTPSRRPSGRPGAVMHRSYPPASETLNAIEPRLSVVHEGVLYEVTKPHFVVGRQAPSSDLTINDPAVSRQHAMVERTANHFYLIDMGSTNGVEYQGERILRKEIVNGDRFHIGDHELLFVLQ